MTATTSQKLVSLPLIQRQKIGRLFIIACIPIHTWAMVMFLHHTPSLLLHMEVWDIFGVLAYTLVVALAESLLATGFLLLFCGAFSRRLFKGRCVSVAAPLFLITFVWAIPVHFQTNILNRLYWDMTRYNRLVTVWVISYLAALFSALALVIKRPAIEHRLIEIIDRFGLLAGVYVFLDIGCVIVVLMRITF